MTSADHAPTAADTERLRAHLRTATDRVDPVLPDFELLERAATRRRHVQLQVLTVAAVAMVIAGCAVAFSGPRPAGRQLADTPSTHGPAAQATHGGGIAGTGTPACAPQHLSVSWLPVNHPSMPGVVYFLRLTNTASSPCLIEGYPRLRVVGPPTLHGNRAIYAPGNAALGTIPVAGVHLASGGSALSQVLFGGNGARCATPVWAVTVPGARGRDPVRLTMPKAAGARLCKHMPFEVSPVYPASLRRGLPPAHPAAGRGRRHIAYDRGAATVRAYLATWTHQGLRAANQRFLSSQPDPAALAAGPGLISGRLVKFRPVSWTSPDHFTLSVDLDLRFLDPAPGWAAWGQGNNTRFVTFTRAPRSPTGYRMTLATGP